MHFAQLEGLKDELTLLGTGSLDVLHKHNLELTLPLLHYACVLESPSTLLLYGSVHSTEQCKLIKFLDPVENEEGTFGPESSDLATSWHNHLLLYQVIFTGHTLVHHYSS